MRIAKLFPLFAGWAAARNCNGSKDLCDKKFSEMTWVGSHNSAFVGTGVAHNQETSVTAQLRQGVRFLQAQTHGEDGEIRMCHTSCGLLDVGSLDQYLREVGGWVKKNPDDVVTVLLTNQDAVPVSRFARAFERAGLDRFVFRPRRGRVAIEEWPTLGELLDDDKRVVVFMDFHADTRSVDYILDWFRHFWETPFGETDENFPNCHIDRPRHTDGKGYMYMINHFWNIALDKAGEIKIPTRAAANITNSLESIAKQVKLCEGMWGRIPNVILLDWISEGDAIEAQTHFNGLP